MCCLGLQDVAGHPAVFVGELRLSDFKQVLTKAGIHAEFSGGALICDEAVAVRKDAQGHIGLEGSVCEAYYMVRDLLYKQFAIV